MSLEWNGVCVCVRVFVHVRVNLEGVQSRWEVDILIMSGDKNKNKKVRIKIVIILFVLFHKLRGFKEGWFWGLELWDRPMTVCVCVFSTKTCRGGAQAYV